MGVLEDIRNFKDISISEICDRLRISRQALYELEHREQIKYNVLLEYLDACEVDFFDYIKILERTHTKATGGHNKRGKKDDEYYNFY